jgi:hypothetical protein
MINIVSLFRIYFLNLKIHLMTKSNFTLLITFLFVVFFSFESNAQTKNNANYVYDLMDRKDLPLETIKRMADAHFEVVGKNKGTGHNQFMRWWYEQRFHLDEKGYILPVEKEVAAFNEGIRGMKKESNRAAWTELGPTTMSVTSSWNPGVGRVRHMAVDPSNANILYAASDGGGVWKSTTGGTSWFPTMDQNTIDYASINQVEVDPSNGSTVYAVQRGTRLIKSIDGGLTWAVPYTSSPTTTKKFAIHPTSSNIIVATSSSGIYRSTNGGASWTSVLSATGLEDIATQPGNASVMFASGSGTQCFWRSADAGLTWTNITSGITNSGRTLIGTSASNPHVVYLVQANGSIFGRMYKSIDGGLNFTTTVIGNTTGNNFFGYEPNGVDTRGQAGHDMAIAVNPTNENEVHIAGIICWKSTNGGTSFTATTDWTWNNPIGYNHADVHFLKYFGSTLYSTSDGGVCKSINNADDWTYLWNGMGTRQIYNISCAKTDVGTIGCGAQDNGHAYRFNGGPWNQWLGADGMDVAISSTNASVAIAAIQYGDLSRTTNGGISYSGITEPGAGNWVTPLAWHPSNANTVFGGYAGVFKSIDQGSTWTKISGNTISSNMNVLTIAPSDANYIYGSVGATLYVTTNGGTTWSTYAIGATISSICVHPTTPSKVYITTTATSNNVRVSTNSGATFTTISTGLPAIAARSVAVDDNVEESIYVGMNSGVYYKDNVNPNWAIYGTGLPNVAINELEIHESSNLLRIATYGRGVWEIGLNVGTPTCQAPTSLASSAITNNSATLSWAAVNGASNYTVEYKLASAATWTVLASTISLTSSLSGLTEGSIYDWRVKADCGFGVSNYTAATFTTQSPCNTPTGLAESAIGDNAATVSWAAVSGTTGYVVEYKLATASTWTVLAATTSLSRSLTGLSSGSSYVWRVKSNCGTASSAYANDAFSTTGCTQATVNFSNNPLTHIGSGSSATTLVLNGGSNIEFTISNLGRKTTGNANSRFTEIVRVEYVNTSGAIVVNGTYSGATQSTVNVSIPSAAQSVKVVLYDGLDGNAPSISVNLSSVTYCTTGAPEIAQEDGSVTHELKFEELFVSPNPTSNTLNLSLKNVTVNEMANVTIETMDGRKVMNTTMQLNADAENKLEIDVTNIPTSYYLVRIFNNRFNQQTRFLKL